MPIKLNSPLEKDFILEESDRLYGKPDDEPTRIVVRQATQGAHERRAALFTNIVREMGQRDAPDVIRLIQRFSFEELKRIEVYLTLRACNILDDDEQPLFKFDKRGEIKEFDFNKAWAQLPPRVAQEIYDCVLDVNIDWRPQGDVELGEG